MTTSASVELNVIKSVQINSSSQSIAGTLRAPKSSLLAMAMVPLALGSLTITSNPSPRFRRLKRKRWGPARHATAQPQAGLVVSEERCNYLIGWNELITGGTNSRARAIA